MELKRALKFLKLAYVKELGVGQFGRVHLVTTTDSKKTSYALKEIRKKHFIEREWEVSRKLKGKSIYIVQLFQRFNLNDYVYILMEYCNSGCLSDIMKRGAIPEVVANNILFQIIYAVQVIHENDLVHRDLKSDNILMSLPEVGSPFILKIADFGLTRGISNESLAKTSCGTPYHMAPEILSRAKFYDEKVDIWSVGTIYYQLLTGKRPYSANSLIELQLTVHKPIKRPTNVSISDDAWELLEGMLQKDPQKRFSAFRILQSPLFEKCWKVLGKNGPDGKPVIHELIPNKLKRKNEIVEVEEKEIGEQEGAENDIVISLNSFEIRADTPPSGKKKKSPSPPPSTVPSTTPSTFPSTSSVYSSSTLSSSSSSSVNYPPPPNTVTPSTSVNYPPPPPSSSSSSSSPSSSSSKISTDVSYPVPPSSSSSSSSSSLSSSPSSSKISTDVNYPPPPSSLTSSPSSSKILTDVNYPPPPSSSSSSSSSLSSPSSQRQLTYSPSSIDLLDFSIIYSFPCEPPNISQYLTDSNELDLRRLSIDKTLSYPAIRPNENIKK